MDNLIICNADIESAMDLPFAEGGVRAGFPSPAQDYMENSIDLNRDLVAHPESTFYARVAGDSMIDAGLEEGDILVIDKSLEAKDGDVVVCVIDGEFTVKTLETAPDCIRLHPANSAYPTLTVTESEGFEVWGIVTFVIKKMHR